MSRQFSRNNPNIEDPAGAPSENIEMPTRESSNPDVDAPPMPPDREPQVPVETPPDQPGILDNQPDPPPMVDPEPNEPTRLV